MFRLPSLLNASYLKGLPLKRKATPFITSSSFPRTSYTAGSRSFGLNLSEAKRNVGFGRRSSVHSMSTTTTAPGKGLDQPTKIKIDVTSDSICPFCFIGKRKLDRAIEISKSRGLNAEFDVEFHPFLLDPTLKEDAPVNKRSRYEQKFGADRLEGMEKMMIARGKQVGIEFSYGGTIRQTTELISLAYEKGGQTLQADLVEKLFNGYFEREQDIGDKEFLSSQAVSLDLFSSTDEAKDWLASDEKREEVQRGIHKAQMMGITGVPFFVFNNKYAISGAEDSELFVEVFERFCGQAGTQDGRIPTDLVCN